MSDLSWLNPTPHTIAVYASSPLSPAATQHSLPSGRYPLLGPDFHRLDRTSLRLAHSLDHLVGAAEQRDWEGEAERIGRLEVDYRLVPSRCLHRQVARLLALEDAIDIAGGAPELFDGISRATGIGDREVHGCGYALANARHVLVRCRPWLGHKNIQHTVRYTEMAPDRFRDF